MRAIVCNEYGDINALRLETREDPVPDDKQILVAIKAAGINFPDGLLVQGLYQVRPNLPFVPGMELCGEVLQTGQNVTEFSPGDRIIACNMEYGAFAEKATIPAASAIKIGRSVPAQVACNLLVAHGTAHHALKQRGRLSTGDTLVVTGAAGGTGLAAVQIGKAMGATVIAAASTESKLQLARDNGADHTINYHEENLKDGIRRLTDGRGADVIYDPVGGEVFDAGVRAMARNGRYLIIGFASGNIPKFPVNLALVKEFAVVGVFWGSFVQHQPEDFRQNMTQLLKWLDEGAVSVAVEKTYTLSETVDALQHVMQRKVQGKVSLII